MIRSWQIAHFKSFREPPQLTLSSINVIAGANSSGKSSIIQSILLLKQTLQYGSSNRSIALNGPILRLGSFDDVRNFESFDEAISVSLDIDITEEESRRSGLQSWTRLIRRQGIGTDNAVPSGVRLDVSFKKVDEVGAPTHLPSKSSLSPQLISGQVTVRRKSADGTITQAYQQYELLNPGVAEESPVFANYRVCFDDDSTREITTKKPDSLIQLGSVSHFLPAWTMVRYNETAYNAASAADHIFGEGLLSAGFADPGMPLPQEATDLIQEFLAQRSLPKLSDEEGVTVGQARDELQPMLFRSRMGFGGLLSPIDGSNQLRADLQTLKDQVHKAILASADEVQWDFDFETPRTIGGATEYLKEFLKSGVKYLGPLRDSPRPVYQPEALESTTDVGYRGEHTAAVLDLNGNSTVTVYLPPEEGSDVDYYPNAVRRRMRLTDAVKVWLQYLGVAIDVETADAGVYGNRLQVKTSASDQLHDLTNVGVGVSQVLPLVVMALLAKPGSFLIFEQPELHLHPRVQARLADFFLALAKDGKQTLLETHSEYLVDRLRLRIALAQSPVTNQLISIMFSQKQGSTSELVPIAVNEYGAVANWPVDFFEQSQQDVTRILKAAAARRKALRDVK